MKLNLIQFIAFGFILGWVLADVAQLAYADKMYCGVLTAFTIAVLYNAHGKIWRKLKEVFA